MEQAEQVDPPVDAMLGPLWVHLDEDQRAALTDAWGAYASAATTNRGYTDRDRCTREAVQRAPLLVQASAAGATSVVPADGDPSTTAGRLALVGHR